MRRRRSLVPGGLSIVTQMALSVALVMMAILFTRTAIRIAGADPGFGLAGKIVVRIDPRAGGYTKAQVPAACNMLVERLAAIPGMEAVGLSTSFPVGNTRSSYSQRIVRYEPGVEDGPSRNLLPGDVRVFTVDEGYFDAMGISLLQGRSFDRLDSVADAEPVVIIDEDLARRLEPDGNAVGCLVRHGWFSELKLCRVVGVVPNLQGFSGDTVVRSHLYEPFETEGMPVYVHLRMTDASRQAETAMVRGIARQIRQIDPRLPVVSVASLTDQHRSGDMARQLGVIAKLSLLFGAMTLFLAGLGLYAVKGHSVASRTPEIGLRMALGATRRSVLVLVFRQGAASTLAGLSLGVLLAIVLGRMIPSTLSLVSPMDPMSIAATVLLLAMVSFAASYVPARRAAKVDPMVALRCE